MNLEQEIQRELTLMDGKLFLDKEWTDYGLTYKVKYLMEDGTEPVTFLDWSRFGHPLPLSLDLLTQLRSQEGSISDAIKLATVHNVVEKELRKQEFAKQMEEIAHEYQFEKRGDRKIYHGK